MRLQTMRHQLLCILWCQFSLTIVLKQDKLHVTELLVPRLQGHLVRLTKMRDKGRHECKFEADQPSTRGEQCLCCNHSNYSPEESLPNMCTSCDHSFPSIHALCACIGRCSIKELLSESASSELNQPNINPARTLLEMQCLGR